LLRLAAAEQREERVLVAAHPPRRRRLAVELVLLACGGILELADLLGAAGIGRAAVKCLKLGFEAGADRIALGDRRGRRLLLHGLLRLLHRLLLRMGSDRRGKP
jgi:hypothetical protein